ncbi:hypothetical protein [Cupriavidus necator]|uniref:hypothetical protein n=1 Tax=Cupriavidus necator TaxID=106590 RepID=UPI001E65DEDC|nr:hypothetical protein [Cupriavidus necator]
MSIPNRQWASLVSAWQSMMIRRPGFFTPRMPLFAFGSVSEAVSLYDTSALKATLEQLVDFDRLNSNGVRLSVGAVHVATGKLCYERAFARRQRVTDYRQVADDVQLSVSRSAAGSKSLRRPSTRNRLPISPASKRARSSLQ